MEHVRAWLQSLNIEMYVEAFERNGWDDLDSLKLMTERDITDIIDKTGHVRKVQSAIEKLNSDDKVTSATKKKIVLAQTRLAAVGESSEMLKPIPDEPVYTKSEYYYKNAKTPRMVFYNKVLEELFESAPVMQKKNFEDYLFTEREKRWKRNNKMDQLSRDITFITSDNPACIGYFLERRHKLSYANIHIVKSDVEKIKKIEEVIDSEINEITQENNTIYVNNVLKKGYEKQSEYFQRHLDQLIQNQDHVKNILSESKKLLDTAKDILPGTSAATKHILSRRKKENRKKVQRQKNKRLLLSCEKLLKRITQTNIFRKCCPEKFTYSPKYQIKQSDLNHKGLEDIRPRQQRNAVKKLTACGFFDEETSELLKNQFNKKFKSTMAKSCIDDMMEESNESSIASSESDSAKHYLKEDSSSGDDSDPFDFITVKMLTAEGDTDSDM